MATPKIHILPIKRLLAMGEFPEHSVAILNSSDPVDTSRLPIPSCPVYYQDLDYESPRSFSPALAAQIADFVKMNEASTDHIYVCCQAAQSRSPGIAAALYVYFGRDPMDIFLQAQYQPNALCFRLLTEALGVPVTDAQLDGLLYANMRAFKRALQGG